MAEDYKGGLRAGPKENKGHAGLPMGGCLMAGGQRPLTPMCLLSAMGSVGAERCCDSLDGERPMTPLSVHRVISKAQLFGGTERRCALVGGERPMTPLGGRLERQSTGALERRLSFGSKASQPLQRDSPQLSLSGPSSAARPTLFFN